MVGCVRACTYLRLGEREEREEEWWESTKDVKFEMVAGRIRDSV